MNSTEGLVQLRSVECQGYKAFRELTRVAVKPITIIFGKNNSGKTTLARLPIYAAASMLSDSLYTLHFKGSQFATSFSQLASADQAHPSMRIGAYWDGGKSISIDLQHISSLNGPERVQPTRLVIDDSIEFDIELTDVDEVESATRIFQDRLGSANYELFSERRAELGSLAENTMHIAGARAGIEQIYPVREPISLSLGEVPYALANDSQLLDIVDDWFVRHFDGTRIDLDRAAFAFRLTSNEGVNLSDSGRGTQSALPVVTLLTSVAVSLKAPDFVLVEEPEEHLHPSAHGAIADLIIEASKKSPICIETHSENLILRIRRRISEGVVRAEDVALYYVNDDHTVDEITVDDMGIALNWPIGVFESDVEEAQAIVQARISAIEGKR